MKRLGPAHPFGNYLHNTAPRRLETPKNLHVKEIEESYFEIFTEGNIRYYCFTLDNDEFFIIFFVMYRFNVKGD